MASVRAVSACSARGPISRTFDRSPFVSLDSIMLTFRPCPWRQSISRPTPKRTIATTTPLWKRRPGHSDTHLDHSATAATRQWTHSVKEPILTKSTASLRRSNPRPVHDRSSFDHRPHQPGFQSRLQFLEGTMSGDRSDPHGRGQSPSQYTPTSDNSTTFSREKTNTKALTKRYQPGFQPGDFMCPQCGSHNFRPPEYDLATVFESLTMEKRVGFNEAGLGSPALKVGSDQDRFDSIHDTDMDRTGITSTSFPRELQKGFPGEHGTKDSSKAKSRFDQQYQHRQQQQQQQQQMQPQRLFGTQERQHQAPRRQYPMGAVAHCFECGFESSYEVHLPPAHTFSVSSNQEPSTATSSPPSSSSLPSVAAATTTETTDIEQTNTRVIRHDLRLVKPRDYICPQCQTVNFNNRIHCVGCGSLNPTLTQRIKQGAP